MVSLREGNILVDTGPDLRAQALAVNLRRVDAVLLTHTHADHIMGMDDLRAFNWIGGGAPIPVYGTQETLEDVRRIYDYIFRETQAGGGKPQVGLRLLSPEMLICGAVVRTMEVFHGSVPVQAFRFEQGGASFAYVTDVNCIPDAVMHGLGQLDLLALDAVRYEPHSTHFGLYEALAIIRKLAPSRCLLTHLSHCFDHDEVNATLPEGVELAYDSQIVEL